MKNSTLEVCVDTLESAKNAIKGGATRLELCSSLLIGGLSPSPTLYKQIRQVSTIPIHVMVRPRYGDFMYNSSEMEIMLKEIALWQTLKPEGIVAGVLTADGNLDIGKMTALKEAAIGMNFTLHRAFDVTQNGKKTLEEAKALGITGILTSGQRSSAFLGVEMIRWLKENAGTIQIIPGGGVNSQNILEIYEKTKVTAFHLSGNIIKQSPMKFRRKEVYMGIKGMSEFERWECDPNKIIAVKKVLEDIN